MPSISLNTNMDIQPKRDYEMTTFQQKMPACPYCDSASCTLLVKNLPYPEHEKYFAVNYGMHVCNSCDLLFAAPLDQDTLKGREAYLTNAYNTHRVTDYRKTIGSIWGAGFKYALRRRMRHYKNKFSWESKVGETLRIIKSRNYRTVLDVGCSFGGFVVAAIDAGFDTYGIEPNAQLVEAIDKIEKNRVFQGLFPDETGPLAAYDVIVFHGILYSLPPAALRQTFASSLRLLNSGGSLIVFDLDSANRNNPDCSTSIQGALTLSLVGTKFMQRVAKDFGFSRYEHIMTKSQPYYCFHILVK